MQKFSHAPSLALIVIIITFLGVPCTVWGHGIEGRRMFIEPLFTEDANIKNELDLPLAEFLTLPDGSFRSFNGSLEKSLYPDHWSVVVEQSVISRHLAGRTVSGFDNLEVGTKLALIRSAPHEFVLTPALFVTLPTGARKLVERHTALNPEILFAKGFGDLKTGWLRPLALQGDVGYEFSATGGHERTATYDVVGMYSIPYLNRFIRDADTDFALEHSLRRGHSLRAILGDMFPFVEFNGSTPVDGTAGSTTTFLRPGTLYMGKYFEISVAADVPVRGYQPSRRVGGVVLFDLFLDEIVPGFSWTPFGKRHHRDD